MTFLKLQKNAKFAKNLAWLTPCRHLIDGVLLRLVRTAWVLLRIVGTFWVLLRLVVPFWVLLRLVRTALVLLRLVGTGHFFLGH